MTICYECYEVIINKEYFLLLTKIKFYENKNYAIICNADSLDEL